MQTVTKKTDPTRGSPANPSSNRIASLDGLRALSIWAVMLGHASANFTDSPLHAHAVRLLFSLVALPNLGVTVFFVISGFLITTLLLRDRSRSGRVHLGRFYSRRALRILPAFGVYFVTVLLLGHPSWIQCLYALTFTSSYFFQSAYGPLQHLWTLSVEEQFYLIWPLVCALAPRSAKRCCWAILLLAPVFRGAIRFTGSYEYGHYFPCVADAIAAGCLLALYREEAGAFVRKHFLSRGKYLALWLGTLFICFVAFKLDFFALWGLAFCAIALTICAAIENRGRFLNSRPLVWTGLLSYSLYLWQQPMLTLPGPAHNIPARLVATFALAYLSYRFIEQPVLNFGSRKNKPSVSARPAEAPKEEQPDPAVVS